jgi:predicted peroxiredoxin
MSAYTCPDKGGAYAHRRARYFGAYANKKVGMIFEIKAVVEIWRNGNGAKIKWSNVETDKSILIDEAKTVFRSIPHLAEEIKQHGIQVFLLENGSKTNFIKSTAGGMFGSKRYFENIARGCADSAELATTLNNKTWEQFLVQRDPQ